MRVHGHAILTRVSADTRKLLDATCHHHGIRLSDLIREALFAHLERDGLTLPPEAAARRVRPVSRVAGK